MCFLKHQRGFIEHRESYILDHAVSLDIAEEGYLVVNLFINMSVRSHYYDIRRDAHVLKLSYGMLRRLGLVFP